MKFDAFFMYFVRSWQNFVSNPMKRIRTKLHFVSLVVENQQYIKFFFVLLALIVLILAPFYKQIVVVFANREKIKQYGSSKIIL